MTEYPDNYFGIFTDAMRAAASKARNHSAIDSYPPLVKCLLEAQGINPDSLIDNHHVTDVVRKSGTVSFDAKLDASIPSLEGTPALVHISVTPPDNPDKLTIQVKKDKDDPFPLVESEKTDSGMSYTEEMSATTEFNRAITVDKTGHISYLLKDYPNDHWVSPQEIPAYLRDLPKKVAACVLS